MTTKQVTTYTVRPLDVWGNDEDGYNVNDVYPSVGTVEIPDEATDKDVIDALADAGFVDIIIDMDEVRIDGDERGYDFCIEYKGKPELELRVKR